MSEKEKNDFVATAFYEEVRRTCRAYSLDDALAFGRAAIRQGWHAVDINDMYGNLVHRMKQKAEKRQ